MRDEINERGNDGPYTCLYACGVELVMSETREAVVMAAVTMRKTWVGA